MLKVLLGALLIVVLAACDEAAAPKATLPSVPPAAAEPAKPAEPAEPPAAGGATTPTPDGGGGVPLPTVTNNIVFEIVTDAGPSRSSSTVALPTIEGTRQESSIGGTLISVHFPDGFTYSYNASYDRYVWRRRQDASAITADWMASGGSILISYSFDSGSTWFASLASNNLDHIAALPSWGRNESGGYVQLELQRPSVALNRSIRHGVPLSTSRGNIAYTCTTTERSAVTDPPHQPTLKIVEGVATATAKATLTSGVITTVDNIQHGSGTFAGTNVDYTWQGFWEEPQRGNDATFTFTVTGGQISAITVDAGGTGYTKPCTPPDGFTKPNDYYDKSRAGYWLTAVVKESLQYFGSNRLLVRFAIITP